MRPLAFVLGRGAVSAFGEGVDALVAGVFAGERGVRPLERLAGTDCLTEVAAEVPRAVLDAAGGEAGLALYMARRAAEEALGETPREDVALVVATTKADMSGVCAAGDGLANGRRLTDRLAEGLGCGGERAAVSCACSSGLSAAALAGRWLATGRASRVLVVGVDALSAFVLRGFSSLLALDPGPCRPLDAGRRGLSVGEGAGALLLGGEDGPAWLAGWGESNDANHVTGPSRDGAGLRLAAERAIARAGLSPADVDCVHLHATATRYNDASEALALVGVFGGTTPLAFGTKAQTGHTLGATGVLETILLLEALERGEVPGNVGLETTDVDAHLTLPRGRTPLPRARTGLKVSAGFGGINAALVVRR